MADEPPVTEQVTKAPKSPGFWRETWQRFRRRKAAMLALTYVLLMALVALFAPAIAGTKPVVCKYKGNLYFPALGYFNPKWENPVFQKDRFRKRYPKNLKEKDPESWAIWPLVYQDPFRRITEDEWPGQPENPTGADGVPSRYNWFGTNQQGFDVFAMMVHGTRIALLVGFVSMGIAATVGITLGALAGYFGGWVDIIISRLIEVVLCIPALVLILAMLAIVEKATIWHIMAVIGFTRWTGIARLARAEFLRLKQSDYVTAAKSLGAGQMRVIFKHILRNSLAPVLVPITFGIASAILLESGLSLLGCGTPPPNPSWGNILREGKSTIEQTWWLILFPGLAIFFTVLAYNLIGEGLQEATDPRLRNDD
ncbi:ABC transporter permease [Aeoliella mucimassa]|uniref:Inner membrane ABC transporter permease protein YejE n=1 Tax=Aeoliella mucimassa TaxID=2527972 RepID=A0A518AHV7_9BACT|nr:ABC transporter permease [Aeoliella mucimassa]QDU54295.1 Inner membrane ABC transporter permease protein YejE [Aeoliella mucimassa]